MQSNGVVRSGRVFDCGCSNILISHDYFEAQVLTRFVFVDLY